MVKHFWEHRDFFRRAWRLSGVALIAIGVATSLFTGRGFWVSAGRQLLIGYLAAAVTFGVGRLVGVAVS